LLIGTLAITGPVALSSRYCRVPVKRLWLPGRMDDELEDVDSRDEDRYRA